jgi:hypothetical protein
MSDAVWLGSRIGVEVYVYFRVPEVNDVGQQWTKEETVTCDVCPFGPHQQDLAF